MNKYQKIATRTLELVGGKENIINLYHCMTRLRFVLEDKDVVSQEEIKKIEGVAGLNWSSSGELQVIVGPDVDNVYKEVLALTGKQETDKPEKSKDAEKTPLSAKGIFNNIIGMFSACMNPLVPTFVLLGTFNVVAALIGPMFFKLVTEESALYTNFYYVGQAVIYFLPVLIAITGSKHFKTNAYLSVILACLMVYPDLMTAISNGYSVYGIPTTAVAYNASVIPILLVLFAQSYAEKLIDRIIPASLKVLLVPFGVVAVMLPLEFCVLGPLGTFIGGALANIIVGLNQAAGPLETMLVSAFVPFITAFGIGRPIFFICMSMLFANGVEYAYMPIAMCTSNFVAAGIALGYLVKSKSPKDRQLGASCSVAGLLGGVSEPTLFGILLPNKKTYLPAIIGGAVGGLFLGIMKVGYYQFGASNVLSVMGFIGGSQSNFIYGCIAAGLCLAVSFVMMLVLYRTED